MVRKITPVALFLILIIVILLGQYNFTIKSEASLENAAAAQQKEEEQKAKEQEEAAKKKAAEAKKVYEEHKGETLVYSPMGDSLSEGWYASQKNKAFVSVLGKLIEDKMGYDVEIMPGAVAAGTGLKDNGIPNLNSVIQEQPDFVTIEFGTNDLRKDFDKAYSDIETFEERLTKLVTELKSLEKKPKILLVTTWNHGESSLKYDSVIKTVGKEQNIEVVDISNTWLNRTDTYGPAGEESFIGETDNWHPNDKGHELIANKIYDSAYELLK